MKKSIKNLSGNELSELIDLDCEIIQLIGKYSHVRDYMPKVIIDNLESHFDKLVTESQRREDENYN